VISINIDKFKSMNSSFGLVLGDSLLLTIARRLQRHLGPNDTLARIGGDQFAILVPAEQPAQELAAHAERIRRSLRSPIKIAAQEIVLTGSLGVAVYDGTEAKCEELLKKAEIAMYRAKRGGADRIEVFGRQMRADLDERVALESDLRKALEKNQLRVLYQPIVYLPTEELAGFEAVIRWDHPQLGVINPSAFVSIAEDSDLVVKLGSHVLMRAARDAARWQKEHPRADAPLFVSVNVASRQLFRQDLIQEIRHILGRNVVPKGSLKLEVSEQLAMENPEQATEILEWLRGAGAEIALDDFGMGYSSFAYLERLPFDTIKIDQAIMQSGGANGESVLVRSIVALAHELGKKVVAKGVESGEEIAFLRSIGCEYAQGGYCGDPIPDTEVVQVLKMLRRSESKLKPRGMFRTKPKKRRDSKQETGPARGEVLLAASGNGSLPPPRSADAAGGAETRAQARNVRSLPNSAVRVRPRAQTPPQQQIRTQGGGGPGPALSMLPPPAAVAPVPPLPPNPLIGAGGPPPPRTTIAPPPSPPPHLRPVEHVPPAPPMPPPLPATPPAMTGGGTRPPWPQEASVPPRPPVHQAPAAVPMPPPAQPPFVVPAPPPATSAPTNGSPPPDFSGLPPAIAESLARLAGSIKPPAKKSPESSGA
jgi:diguanylate cyclase (GGDEF)-like protein